MEEGGRKENHSDGSMRRTQPCIAWFELEKVPTGKEAPAVGKRKETDCPLELPEGSSPAYTSMSAQDF